MWRTMLFKDTKVLNKELNARGHSMLLIDDTLVCEKCMRWAKHRNDGQHAWGDALGSDCKVNNHDIDSQQPDDTLKPEKKRSKKK